MSKKFTYLFGAGASADIIPVVSELSERLRSFGDSLGGATDDAKFLARQMRWLAEKTAEVASINTLAKQFWFRGDDTNLRRLKNLLTVFFIICKPHKISINVTTCS